MKHFLIYILLGIGLSLFVYFNITNNKKVIYKTKIKRVSIDYQSITDSITNSVNNVIPDTAYTFIDSVVIKVRYHDSIRIKDSLVLVPYSVVSFDYSDSLLFASVSTYYNEKASKYNFKYTIKPSKYNLKIDYLSPDTLNVSFKHKYFFNKDTIIVLNGINQYIKSNKNKWWDNYWIGLTCGTLFTAGTVFLVK